MRRRLAQFLYVPSVALLAVLGLAYACSVAQANQQEAHLERLRDAAYLALVARQSLVDRDTSIVSDDLERYREVYGIGAAVLDSSGETWASNGLDAAGVEEAEAALAGRRSHPHGHVLPWQIEHVVVAEPVFVGGDVAGAVVIVADADALSRDAWIHVGLLIAGAAGALLLAGWVAGRIADWVLRPVRSVEAAMWEIGSGDLAARIPASVGPPEIGGVVERFNEMADKVETLVQRRQEFVSNVSHELRTPLSGALLRIDELQASLPSEHTVEVEEVRSEVLRIARTLDEMLRLADDAMPDHETEQVDVQELVRHRAEDWRRLVGGREITVTTPTLEPSWAMINRTAVEAALDAIIHNAVKYSPDSTPVEMAVDTAGGLIEVTVRDHGTGVPPDELEKITERAWRSPSHADVRGTGLGLSIAAELLATNGGSLELRLPRDGGLLACLRIPTWEVTA
ncbi:sensor histidine kinase [Georgenia alba]|uniref:histidine kinase n=1 Tax=Georgenia alba TaxID=2233858 RepID=A0ABW2Q6C0_9MICO